MEPTFFLSQNLTMRPAKALNGFLLILTCDGEVFYTSHTVETYLGFHQVSKL